MEDGEEEEVEEAEEEETEEEEKEEVKTRKKVHFLKEPLSIRCSCTLYKYKECIKFTHKVLDV